MSGLNTSPEALLQAATEAGLENFETGRKIVTFREGAVSDGLGMLASSELRVARSSDFSDTEDYDDVGDAGMIVFEELGVALVAADTPIAEMTPAILAGTSDSAIAAVEPETFVFAEQDMASYLKGFAAAADRIRADLATGAGADADEPLDEAQAAAFTWGLIATRTPVSRLSGRGIRVAILDTGFDATHPDFRGRGVVRRSFIPNQSAHDVHGHGTHCTGTACGPRAPVGVPRYGIAHEASIFIGKVLSDSGFSVSGSVLSGMNWAIANRCQVISMSLGGSGGPFTYYTEAGRRALAAGCLIVAASGNGSARPGRIAPTGAPANSPTIVAVAAIDEQFRVAGFSSGGKVEIAAPGVNVFSSLPMPRRYASWNGTSMATPHVAGVAALLAQANPNLRGATLRDALLRMARRLNAPAADVGRGLVQAPVMTAAEPAEEQREAEPAE